jgi:hypothetical protein
MEVESKKKKKVYGLRDVKGKGQLTTRCTKEDKSKRLVGWPVSAPVFLGSG